MFKFAKKSKKPVAIQYERVVPNKGTIWICFPAAVNDFIFDIARKEGRNFQEFTLDDESPFYQWNFHLEYMIVKTPQDKEYVMRFMFEEQVESLKFEYYSKYDKAYHDFVQARINNQVKKNRKIQDYLRKMQLDGQHTIDREDGVIDLERMSYSCDGNRKTYSVIGYHEDAAEQALLQKKQEEKKLRKKQKKEAEETFTF